MSGLKTVTMAAGVGVATAVLTVTPAMAAVETETAFIFNTLSFLMHGFLVMFMAAGFAMLEAGLVRSKTPPCNAPRTSACIRSPASCFG